MNCGFECPQNYLTLCTYQTPMEKKFEKVFKTLKAKKSPGLDSIRSETLKAITDFLKKKEFPSDFEDAVIKPVYQQVNKDKLFNFIDPFLLLITLLKYLKKLHRKT